MVWVPRQGPVPTAHVGKGSSPPPTCSPPLAPMCLKSVFMVLLGVIFRGPRPFSETQPHSRSAGLGPCLWGSLSAQSPILASALRTKLLRLEPRSLVLACPGFLCLSAALGLVCGMQAFSSCGERVLRARAWGLWCLGKVAPWPVGIIPEEGLNSGSRQWKCEALTTGPPRK